MTEESTNQQGKSGNEEFENFIKNLEASQINFPYNPIEPLNPSFPPYTSTSLNWPMTPTRFIHIEVVYLTAKAQEEYDDYSNLLTHYFKAQEKLSEAEGVVEVQMAQEEIDNCITPAQVTEAKENLFKDKDNWVVRKKAILAADVESFQEWVNGLTYIELRNGSSNYINMEYDKFQELINQCIF